MQAREDIKGNPIALDAIPIAEEILSNVDNLNLLQFLGWIYDFTGNPNRAVMYNQKALQIEPYHIMSQFNLAVALSHTGDSKVALGGQSMALCKRIINEYTKCEQILKAYDMLGRGTVYDWRVPLFKAHGFKNLSKESLWERTGDDFSEDNPLTAQETFWLNESLALYQQAEGIILANKDLHERWLTECLRHCGESLEMLGQKEEAKKAYTRVVELGKESVFPDVKAFVKYAQTSIQSLSQD
jgi:tetratricopeptide (TPR) repeat protein